MLKEIFMSGTLQLDASKNLAISARF